MNVTAGTQLLGMAFVTMVFAVLGFLSPANRQAQKCFSYMPKGLFISINKGRPCYMQGGPDDSHAAALCVHGDLRRLLGRPPLQDL